MKDLKQQQNIGEQVKVSTVVSNYPQYTMDGSPSPMGSIAQGAAVNGDTTKSVAQASFEQGQFFKAFSKVSFNELQHTAANDGDETWHFNKTINGHAHQVTLKKSDILTSVALTPVVNDEEIDTAAKKYNIQKNQTYITVDGKRYFVRMNIPMHFGTGNQHNVIVDTAYFIVGTEAVGAAIAGVIAKLGIDAFASALASINTAVFKVLWSALVGVMQVSYAFVQAFVGAIIGGETVTAAFAAGQAAVGEAIAEGAFAAVTASALAYTVVGILVIAAIFLILTYALHYSYQNVYIYNLTRYDLDFDFGYIYEGNQHNVESQHLPAYQKKTGPNNIDLGSWYSATGFRFQSDSQFYGLGYAISFALKHTGTQSAHKQMACMFDIPFVGNNSLKASATKPGNLKSWYTKNEGAVKKTQHAANDGELEIIVTYDYLSGTHRDPETGAKDYIYNSLVIIREKQSGFELNPSAGLFDNAYLSIPSQPVYEFGSNDFAIEAWVKPDASGTLFGKKSTEGGAQQYAGFLVVLEPNGTVKFATDNGFGYNQIISAPAPLYDGHWHHLAAVREGGQLKLYHNGEALATTPSGSLPSPLTVSNSLPLLIGNVQQAQEPHRGLSGAVSDARLWNRALSAADLQQSINRTVPANAPGLVGNWPLHENGQDQSTTQNNATSVGSIHFGKN